MNRRRYVFKPVEGSSIVSGFITILEQWKPVISNTCVKSAGTPYTYGQLISFGGLGATQLFLGWNAEQTSVGQNVPMIAYMRSWRDVVDGWTAWKQFAFTS